VDGISACSPSLNISVETVRPHDSTQKHFNESLPVLSNEEGPIRVGAYLPALFFWLSGYLKKWLFKKGAALGNLLKNKGI